MSSTEAGTQQVTGGANVGHVDTKLEVVVIPVSDVDRAKEFYGRLGWRLDADFAFDNGFRVVQYTPPGSPCSIQFGPRMTQAAPGTAQNMYLVVADIDAARADLDPVRHQHHHRGTGLGPGHLPGRRRRPGGP